MGRARWPGGFVIPAIVSRLTGTTFRVPVMLQFGQTLPTDDTELPREQQTSMLAIITALLGARHLIVRTALLAVVIVGAFTLTAPRVFVSTSGGFASRVSRVYVFARKGNVCQEGLQSSPHSLASGAG